MVVTVMTILLVNQDEDEEQLKIFTNLHELDTEHQEFLQETIKQIILLFDEVMAATAEPVMGVTSICNLGIGTGLESRRRITTINDIQLYKKVEDQQMIIDSLQNENDYLKKTNQELTILHSLCIYR